MADTWVNPATLRELATKAGESARVAEDEHVAQKVQTSCDGLPGSSLQWAAQQIGSQLSSDVSAFVTSARGTADRVAGAAHDYRMTDDQAAAALTKAWPGH